ncbi:hypothetical protein ZEAMMB73_Zm00001d036778 [Zea mays]|uniref:Uncharacterized protein n=1 Tax=Zea mays TaxID=4577 RepID=A0A1D6LR37_MAIZE|nr:hypothetical protein ZEAMMB73_Zm00001d036778 [Zea mays]
MARMLLAGKSQKTVLAVSPELLSVTGSKGGADIKLELSVGKIRTGEETARSNVLTGRRLAFGDAVMEQKETENSGIRTDSGAKYAVGKCGHGGGKDLSMNCSKHTPKVYFDGHIPFTADYRSPRKHPPKNN